jgi:uncharacterized membrane protein (DUF373 family)
VNPPDDFLTPHRLASGVALQSQVNQKGTRFLGYFVPIVLILFFAHVFSFATTIKVATSLYKRYLLNSKKVILKYFFE